MEKLASYENKTSKQNEPDYIKKISPSVFNFVQVNQTFCNTINCGDSQEYGHEHERKQERPELGR